MSQDETTPPPQDESRKEEKLHHKNHETFKSSKWEIYFPSNLDAERDAIHVASFMPMIYFWPTMVTFLSLGIIQYFMDAPSGSLGWFAVIVFSINVLVIVQDFDQKKFLILMLGLIATGLGIWILNMKEITFLATFTRWLVDLAPSFSTSAYLVMGIILMIFFLWSLVRPMFNYWRFEHNEFVHYIQPFGRDQSVPRMGSTVSKDIPDILEFILTFGGGSLIIKREGQVMAEIPHIPFLGLRMRAIEKMLSETRVTTR